MFDIIQLLEDNDISVSTSGKNTSRGWVNIQCPFCNDSSNHLGINLKSGVFNCWKCSETGKIEKLIMELLGITWTEAKRIIQQHSEQITDIPPEIKSWKGKVILPPFFTKDLPPIHFEYLRKRGFKPYKLATDFALQACFNVSKWKYRIIIPIYLEGQLVTFTSRDVTGNHGKKYLNLPNEESLVPIKSCLYNLDTVENKALVVEGPADVWRFGHGSVATFGILFTDDQLSLLAKKNIEEIYIMYDGEKEAIDQAKKLACELKLFIPKVTVLELPSGDPAENFTDEEATKFKEEIFK